MAKLKMAKLKVQTREKIQPKKEEPQRKEQKERSEEINDPSGGAVDVEGEVEDITKKEERVEKVEITEKEEKEPPKNLENHQGRVTSQESEVAHAMEIAPNPNNQL